MTYVAPSTVTTLQTYTSAAHNVIVGDIIDHETRLVDLAPITAAWTSYTPTIGNGWTLGNGTITASYLKVGKLVAVRLKFTVGNGTKAAAIPTFTLPVNAVTGAYFACDVDLTDFGTDNTLGKAYIYTPAFGQGVFGIAYPLVDVSVLKFRAVTSTAPFTWVANDSIELRGPLIYEAA